MDELTVAGTLARRAADQSPPSRKAIQQAREAHAFMRGEGLRPGLRSVVTRIGMVSGMERSRDELLAHSGPGVGAALRQLTVGAGDAVGEQDPADPGLAVCLALEGVKTFVTLSYPSRHEDISRELAQYREGKVGHTRERGRDMQPLRLDSHYVRCAHEVGKHLSLRLGSGFGALPSDVAFKALISRGVFQYLDTPAVEASIQCAARLLQPGGGLVFEFAHAAGQPAPATAGLALNPTSFRQLRDAVNESGLQLRCLYVTFRKADQPHQQVIPTRRVQPDAHGLISLVRADAAAWSGWDEIFRQPELHGQPVLIDASGLLAKPEK